MDIGLVKKLLNRFTKEELRELGREWGQRFRLKALLSERAENGGRSFQTKRAMVALISRECIRKNISHKELGDLDLLYVTKHPRSKLWKAYELVNVPCGSSHKVMSPQVFERKLQMQLENYFSSSIRVVVKDHAYWIRVCLQEDLARGSKSTAYIVHKMNTNSLVAAHLRLSHVEYVFQAFSTLLGATDVEDMTLQGHCVKSLIQLTANKHNKGVFGKRHLGNKNPLVSHQSSNANGLLQKGPILNENWVEKNNRENIIDNAFGSDTQPCLEKVEYKIETKFAGGRFAPGMVQHNGIFRCQVKFEGPSIIQGIKGLGLAGLAELPMKDHLGKIHCLAQSKFLLRTKTQSQSSQQE